MAKRPSKSAKAAPVAITADNLPKGAWLCYLIPTEVSEKPSEASVKAVDKGELEKPRYSVRKAYLEALEAPEGFELSDLNIHAGGRGSISHFYTFNGEVDADDLGEKPEHIGKEKADAKRAAKVAKLEAELAKLKANS